MVKAELYYRFTMYTESKSSFDKNLTPLNNKFFEKLFLK